MGLTEVAALTGLLKSDVHRILKSLEQFGFVEQDAGTRRYSLGLGLLKLGHLVHDRLHLNDIAKPFMQQLSDAADASVDLAVFDPVDEEMIFVEQIDSPSEAKVRWRIGQRVPAHATAVGKTLLAYLDPELARKVIEQGGLKRKTRYTITDPLALERELAEIREAGYAVDREEAVPGVCCVAAPVRDHGGRVVAAVSGSMLAVRLERSCESDVAALVLSAAARVSAALGYLGRASSAPPIVVPHGATFFTSFASVAVTAATRRSASRARATA